MITLVLGCAIFGEGQGTKYDAVVSTVDEVKLFDTKKKAEAYGEDALKNGGDSYFIYNQYDKIKWMHGTKRLFNSKLKQVIKEFEL